MTADRQMYLCVMVADSALFGISSGKDDVSFLRIVSPFLRHLKTKESVQHLVDVLEEKTKTLRLQCERTDDCKCVG